MVIYKELGFLLRVWIEFFAASFKTIFHDVFNYQLQGD